MYYVARESNILGAEAIIVRQSVLLTGEKGVWEVILWLVERPAAHHTMQLLNEGARNVMEFHGRSTKRKALKKARSLKKQYKEAVICVQEA